MRFLNWLLDRYMDYLDHHESWIFGSVGKAEKERFKRDSPHEWEFLYGKRGQDEREDEVCYW